jgi:hypothetical protein
LKNSREKRGNERKEDVAWFGERNYGWVMGRG